MRFFDLIQLIFDNLKRRKGRVAMTAVGVMIGTASIVLLVSLANGFAAIGHQFVRQRKRTHQN